MTSTIEIFCCYSHKDEPLLDELKKHVGWLLREGLIKVWHDRKINAGEEWKRKIDMHLNTAHIILLLVSPDFMNSDYCYEIEMRQAMERYERKEAHVIPIILRHVPWQKAPFGKLKALPIDGKPVLSSSWHNQDEAFFNVAEGIQKVVEEVSSSLVEASERIENEPSQKKTFYSDGSAYTSETSDTFYPLEFLIKLIEYYKLNGLREFTLEKLSLDIRNFNHSQVSMQDVLDRKVILTRLRNLYVLSHDGISPGLMVGLEPLPKEWTEELLERMGIAWRQDQYY